MSEHDPFPEAPPTPAQVRWALRRLRRLADAELGRPSILGAYAMMMLEASGAERVRLDLASTHACAMCRRPIAGAHARAFGGEFFHAGLNEQGQQVCLGFVGPQRSEEKKT